jgi:hypothetical protein
MICYNLQRVVSEYILSIFIGSDETENTGFADLVTKGNLVGELERW